MTATALSVRQPWAWGIIYGSKDVENRTWWTRYRGLLLIHAGKRCDEYAMKHGFNAEERPGRFYTSQWWFPAGQARSQCGGIVGRVELVDCIQNSRSAWAEPGLWHWILQNPEPLPFRPLPGRLGLWQAPA